MASEEDNKQMFKEFEERFKCVSSQEINELYHKKDENQILIMPANRYNRLSLVMGFMDMNGKTYMEYIIKLNPEIKDDLKESILGLYRKINNDLPDKEYFEEYFSMCDKAINILEENGYNVKII
jgi:hypothetical protein